MAPNTPISEETYDGWDDWFTMNLPSLRQLAEKHGLETDTVLIVFWTNMVRNAVFDVEDKLSPPS